MKQKFCRNIALELLVALLVMMASAGCRDNMHEINASVESKDAFCPKPLGNGVTIKGINVDTLGIIYKVTLDSAAIKRYPLSAFKCDSAKIVSGITNKLLTVTDDLDRELIALCAEEGLAIIYRYYDDKLSDSVDIIIPAVDLIPATIADTSAVVSAKTSTDTVRR